MFYGLTEMEEDYYAGKVNKFIALGPCIYYKSKYSSYEELLESWQTYRDTD